jgi:hypothetical protein
MHESPAEHSRTLPRNNVEVGGADTLGKMTFTRLFNQHGPLVAVEVAMPLLGFRTRGAFNKAIGQKRLLIHVIRPEGRKQSFVATKELAFYLARLAGTPERSDM